MSTGFWVGPLGGMVGLPGLRGSLSINGEYPREWDISLPGATAAEAGLLQPLCAHDVSFSTNLGGVRRARCSPTSPRTAAVPMHLVTPQAAVTNTLTPAASMWQGWTYSAGVTATPAGPVPTVDGQGATSVALAPNAQATYATSPTFPVVPGQPVTVSAYTRRGSGLGTLRLQWVDVGTGAATDASFVTMTASTGPLPRYTVSVPSVPAGQVAARIQIRGAILAANPAVTWTTGPQQWGAGQGCSAGILHGLSHSPSVAGLGNAHEEVSFTVSEVGT